MRNFRHVVSFCCDKPSSRSTYVHHMLSAVLTGSISCKACPILLRDSSLDCLKDPSAANAFSSKKKPTELVLSRKYWSDVFFCVESDDDANHM